MSSEAVRNWIEEHRYVNIVQVTLRTCENDFFDRKYLLCLLLLPHRASDSGGLGRHFGLKEKQSVHFIH